MCALEIYVLNVGQGDTAIIKTPQDNIVVIDAYRPAKVKDALDTISAHQTITHLVVTHPHRDHYTAVTRLLADCDVKRVTLAPFWFYAGKPGYHQIINSIQDHHVQMNFLSGYERTYPDGGAFPALQDELYLELLGPPNDVLEELDECNELNPNHLSIMARLCYDRFSMVFAADAQMENWYNYDREGLLDKECNVLKAAHHGSKRGTQYERLERLAPELVIVSSDPETSHELPDLIGSAVFLDYDGEPGCMVALTSETGTIKIEAQPTGQYGKWSFHEGTVEPISGLAPQALPLTDWATILASRVP